MSKRTVILVGIAVVAVVAVALALTVSHQRSSVTVTASSSAVLNSTELLASSGPDPARPARWASDRETAGASLTVKWQSTTTLGRVEARAPADPAMAIREAYVAFSDGSSLHARPDAAGDVVFSFTRRDVTWAKFTVTTAAEGATAVGLSSLRFTDDDALPSKAETGAITGGVASASSSAMGTSAAMAVDAGSTVSPAATGAAWRSMDGDQQWLQVDWPEPHELVSVQVYGSADEQGAVASGRLEFGDGSVVHLGGVAAGGGEPTTVAFMPRVTRSVRLVTTGSGPVAVRELSGFEVGNTPLAPAPAAGVTINPPVAESCAIPAQPYTGTGNRLVCPSVGAVIGNRVRIVAATPPGRSVKATAWVSTPGDERGTEAEVGSTTTSKSGYAELELDATRLLKGPATVRLDVTGGDDETIYVQMFNPTGVAQSDAGPMQHGGMTLAWGDDFATPLSISRTGTDAVYAATKPAFWGPSEFGEAVFADPAWGTGNIGTVGEEYLRIRGSTLPQGRTDPFGWNRTRVGGMLSSARVGGSGFTAQYGYFEARILGAPGTGTWPAFWSLSSRSLTDPKVSTGEVDTVELYGRDKVNTCHAIHNWVDGKDDPQLECVDDNGITDWALQWHTYAARVTPTGTVFYVDGHEVATLRTVANADQPFYFMVNLAMGGGWPVDLASTGEISDLYVDYVRVYT